MSKKPVYGMLDEESIGVLKAHADECDRSVSREHGSWLAFGASAVLYTDTFRPDKQREMLERGWTREQLEAERQSYLDDMANALTRALPHAVDPGAAVRSLLPALSLN